VKKARKNSSAQALRKFAETQSYHWAE